ncbi:hypothetical protein [Winogradskya humida]|nr:hypothetical protein [Actinoplanes humidus]
MSLTVRGEPPTTSRAAPHPAGTLHVVQFSGGIGSWAAAMRVAEEHGTDNLILLAADTKAEDPDLWRFVADAGAHFGVEPVIVADGRTPWQVFADQRFVGNSRIAPCSVHLKQKPCRRWLTEHADPDRTVLYVGIDWSEQPTRELVGTAAPGACHRAGLVPVGRSLPVVRAALSQ